MTRSLPRIAISPGWKGSSANRPPPPRVAGVRKMAAQGVLDPDATVVAVLTGHGLKDPHTAEREVPGVIEAAPTLGAVAVALGWA